MAPNSHLLFLSPHYSLLPLSDIPQSWALFPVLPGPGGCDVAGGTKPGLGLAGHGAATAQKPQEGKSALLLPRDLAVLLGGGLDHFGCWTGGGQIDPVVSEAAQASCSHVCLLVSWKQPPCAWPWGGGLQDERRLLVGAQEAES